MEDHSAEVTARTQYRQLLLPSVLYGDAEPAAPASGDVRERLVMATFLAGRDLLPDATHWRDLSLEAYGTMAHLGNSHALLAGLKQGRVVDKKQAFDVTLEVEEILSKPRSTDHYRQVRGVRVSWGAKPRRPTVYAAAEAEAAPEPAAAADPASTADDEEQQNTTDPSRLKQGVLGRALAASCREGKHIQTLVDKFSKTPTGRAAASRGHANLSQNMPYRFAANIQMENIYHDLFRPYLLGRGSVRTASTLLLLSDDPRPWCRIADGHHDPELAACRVTPANLAHPLCPDGIFTKETAVFYGRNDALEARQWRLSSYVPNVPAADEDRIATLLQPSPAGDNTWCAVYPDQAHPMRPFPGVTYRVHPHAQLMEVLLPYMPLPHPMGTWLPPDVADPDTGSGSNTMRRTIGFHLPAHVLDELVQATFDLGAIEEREEEHHRTTAAGSDSWVRQVSNVAGRAGSVVMRPLASTTLSLNDVEQQLAAADTPNAPHVSASQCAAVQELQQSVCAAGVRHLASYYKKASYKDLLGPSEAPDVLALVSTNEQMAMLDLLPLSAADMRTSGPPRSQTTRALQQLLTNIMSATGIDVTHGDARSAIAQQVDVFPEWQTARNAFLTFRQRRQLEKAALEYHYDRSYARMIQEQSMAMDSGALADAEADMQILEHEAVWRKKREDLAEQSDREFDKLFRTTTLASKSFLEARDYALKHYMKPGVPATLLTTLIEGRPFISIMQYLTDVFVQVEQVSNQNLPYLQRVWLCLFQAHRWKPRRSQPAMNYVIAGVSGAGKSFVITRAEFLAPPGIVQNLTTSTTASMNVDEDFDNQAIVQEEVDTGILFTQQPGGKDLGATDKANFAKARMTSFQTVTQYFYYDEETKQRMPRKCYSSQHLVFIGGTNQDLTHMDPSIGRRLLIDTVAQDAQRSDGGKATDTDDFGLFNPSDSARKAQHMLRELHCAFMYYETGIKAGAWPEVLDDGARILLNNVLATANERKGVPVDKGTKKHWMLEAARTLAIIEACFAALFLPSGHLLHKLATMAPPGEAAAGSSTAGEMAMYERLSALRNELGEDGKIERWSWRMFQKRVVPAVKVTKEHLIEALTLFDFLYAPRSEEQVMHTLATKICRLAEPARWRFRIEGFTLDKKPIYDYDFFAVSGNSDRQVCEYVADQNKFYAQLRTEDIKAMLEGYTKQRKDVPHVRARQVHGDGSVGGGSVASLYLDTVGGNHSVQPLFWENEPSPSGGTKNKRQLCVSVEFLCSRFGFSVDTPPEAMAEKLGRLERTMSGDSFGLVQQAAMGMKLAAEVGICDDTRSPLVEAIRHALSNKTLEKSPYELPGMATDLAMRYRTAYTPDQPVLTFAPRGPNEPVVTKRVPMHGAHLMLELQRKASGPLLRRDNYSLPMPTARQSIYEMAGVSPEMVDDSRGFIVSQYDVDYEMAVAQQRLVGDSGLRVYETLYVQSLARELGQSTEAVRAALPPMSAKQPLPWSFGPVAMHIEAEALRLLQPQRALVTNYPAINIYSRLSATAERYRSQHDGTMAAYDDYGAMIDPMLKARKTRQRILTKRSRSAMESDSSDAGEAYRRAALERQRRPVPPTFTTTNTTNTTTTNITTVATTATATTTTTPINTADAGDAMEIDEIDQLFSSNQSPING